MPNTDDSQMQLTRLLRNIGAEFSGEHCLQTVRGIFKSDHRSDYQAFRETAQYVRGRLEESGLSDVQMIPHPADSERSIHEVQQLLAQERGRPYPGFLVEFFRFLETHGHCRIRRREASDV